MPRSIAAIFLFLVQPLLGVSALGLDGHWIDAKTSHFEIYTELDERQAAQSLKIFEQARTFFLQTGFAAALNSRTVRIIDLESETEYAPYLVKPGAYACYQRAHRGDYIVMRDLKPEHYRVAVHEYTHFVVEQAGLKLPVWLNEGLAEFYSTLEPHGNQWLVGRPPAGRLEALERERWLPLETLFTVDGSSSYYNDPAKMQIFYAESWALTHMLAAGNGYSERFNAFVAAISAGNSEAEALELAWGKSVRGVESDLHAYLRQRALCGLLYDAKSWPSEPAPQISDLSPKELDLAFADLLSSNPFPVSDSQKKLMELSRRHPDDAGFEELLGYQALRQKRTEIAASHFSSAVERQSTDPVAVYNSALLQQRSGASAEAVIPLLQRALELNPEYAPARIDLGFTAAKNGRYDLAVSALSQLKSVEANMAFEVYFTIAYCDLRLARFQEAASYALAAGQHARSTSQQNQVSSLLRFLNSSQVSAAR